MRLHHRLLKRSPLTPPLSLSFSLSLSLSLSLSPSNTHSGPGPGRHNDRWLVNMSGINPRLDALFGGSGFTCYGDSIYVESRSITHAERAAMLDATQTNRNSKLNKARTCVEHGIGKVVMLWHYVDHRRNLRLWSSPIGCGISYRVAVLLTNCHTCCKGSNVCNYFACAPPSLASYLRGGTKPQCSRL